MPRNRAHDGMPPMDFTKRAAPVGRREQLHERMERELTNLMRDRRYWEGDTDYRAYVRRQFERVYNDPSGKPGPLRIGAPKIFATEIEPFGGRQRHSATLLVSEGESSTAQARKLKGGPVTNPKSQRKSDAFVSQTERRRGRLESNVTSAADDDQRQGLRLVSKLQSGTDEPGLLDKLWDLHEVEQAGSGGDLEGVSARAEELLGKFQQYEWDTAKTLLSHYLEGSGEPLTVPSNFMRGYPTLVRTYKPVLTFFIEWLMGKRSDSVEGIPVLPVRDGEVVVIGLPNVHSGIDKDLDDFVMWEKSFPGVGDTGNPGLAWALGTEAHYAIGGGTLQGYAVSLTLTREGDEVRIAGQIQFRVWDIYDFAEDDTLGFHLLEQKGSAKPFEVFTEPWQLEVSGYISLNENEPRSAALWLVDQPRIKGTAGDHPTNPRMRQYTR